MTLTWQQSLGLYAPVMVAARDLRVAVNSPKRYDEQGLEACDNALDALHTAAVWLDLGGPSRANELLAVVLELADMMTPLIGAMADVSDIAVATEAYGQEVAALRDWMRADLDAIAAAQA
jgi:hypothetical protein